MGSVATELPTVVPEPAPSGGTIRVTVPSDFGDLHVTIQHDGILGSARPATEAEIDHAPLGDHDIRLTNLTDTALLLVWIGSICERNATLTAERSRIVLAPAPRPGCDAMAVGWGLALMTTEPVNAAAVRTILLPTTILR